jgi:hypothetical protein
MNDNGRGNPEGIHRDPFIVRLFKEINERLKWGDN